MSGTSGFREVRSSTSRSSSNRLLHEQQHGFRTGAWHLLRAHNLIDLSTEISTKQEMVPDTFLIPLVTFKPGTDSLRMKALNDSLHVLVIKVLLGGQLHVVKIPADESLDEIRRAYASFPEVESVGLNYKAVAQ